ncbi:MAG: hypothetical protein HQ546_04830, partial [Planctomycetes bacterium]|nr:hypothetical protein [Planctomycetota bacterium]
MSQISNVAASIAQTQAAQAQQAAHNDSPREATARRANRQQQKRTENREFVEDMAEAAGLKVEPEEGNQSQNRKKRHHSDLTD